MTPRGTDWGLALLVLAGLATGLGTWFAGSPGAAWVFDAHAIGGTALAVVVVVKLRRVWPRLRARPAGAWRGVAALACVALVLGTGLAWSSAGRFGLAGYTAVVWHGALGAVLGAAVFAHARRRAFRRRVACGPAG